MSLLSVTLLHLVEFKKKTGKIFIFKVTTARTNVKSRSHHDVEHLEPPPNVPTKYQLPTHYSFRDIARTRFYRSRSLRQGQRFNQRHTKTLHTYTPNLCPYQVLTSYALQFEIYPGQNFQTQGHYGRVKGQIKVTP